MQITHIYDKLFKKILTLSPSAVTNLINGLFGTAYPPDSTITYQWTEFEDDELKKILADTILTVNNETSYHIEAQMTKDGSIVFRMFEYGYRHAERYRQNEEMANTDRLVFPEPKVVYFYSERNVPPEYTLILDFGTQGTFEYHVPVFSFAELSADELNEKKMTVFLPFLLLKLRKSIAKKRDPETLAVLKKLLLDDILQNIKNSVESGVITEYDALMLSDYTGILYNHLYAHYEEMKELNEMRDQSFTTEMERVLDGIDRKMDAERREKEEIIRKAEAMEREIKEAREKRREVEARAEAMERQMEESTRKLTQQDEEIRRLRAELERYRK